MPYVDGYVIPIPRKNLRVYRRMAVTAGKVWRKYGAIQFMECVGDDLNVKKVAPFPRIAKAKRGETVLHRLAAA